MAGLYVVINGLYVFWLYQFCIYLAELAPSYWIEYEIELWTGSCYHVLSGHNLFCEYLYLGVSAWLVIEFHPTYRALLIDCETNIWHRRDEMLQGPV